MVKKEALDTIQDSVKVMQSRQVVFLLGIMPRSGTNFLAEMLCQHPDCGTPAYIPEDFLLANAHHLVRFVDAVHQSWNKLWADFGEAFKLPLLKALGYGLERYLYGCTEAQWGRQYGNAEKRSACDKIEPNVCLARTPSVENLELLPKLTDAKTIIIVRDGRAVVESGMRSFGWLFEDAVQRWARSADLILRVASDNPQMLCVRYEDLVQHKAQELRKIFAFLGIDEQKYDYDVETPVRGSSTFFDEKEGMNWGQTAKTEKFNPLNRWRHWDRRQHARFNWLAARQLQAFGYEPLVVNSTVWQFYNSMLDTVFPLRHRLRDMARRILPQYLREQILWRRGQRYRRTVANKG